MPRTPVTAIPREAAARDNAAMILTGSVQTAGADGVRIVVSLADAVKRLLPLVWSHLIGRGIENVFAVQEEIAGAVALRLRSGD